MTQITFHFRTVGDRKWAFLEAQAVRRREDMNRLPEPLKTDSEGLRIGVSPRGGTLRNSETTFDSGEQSDRLCSGTSCMEKATATTQVAAAEEVVVQELTQVVSGETFETPVTLLEGTGTSPVVSMKTSLIPVVSVRLIKVTSGAEHWLEQTHMIPVHVLVPESRVVGVPEQAHLT